MKKLGRRIALAVGFLAAARCGGKTTDGPAPATLPDGAPTSGSGGGGNTPDASGAASYALTVPLVGAGIGEYVTSLDRYTLSGPSDVPTPYTTYPAGMAVTLVAIVGDPGSWFAGWSGGGCSGTGNCVVTMSSDQTVTATFHGTVTYTDNEAFPVPPGLSTVSVALWGGGGEGGYLGASSGSLGCNTGTGGGGGGGGAYNAQSVPVVARDQIVILVGCGGCIYNADINQNDSGGDTSFGDVLTAGGGVGGYDSPPAGGAGGSCVGPGCIAGIAGATGSTSSCSGGSGGAAGGPEGGAGGVYGAHSGKGGAPGGGSAGGTGAVGGGGLAVISW